MSLRELEERVNRLQGVELKAVSLAKGQVVMAVGKSPLGGVTWDSGGLAYADDWIHEEESGDKVFSYRTYRKRLSQFDIIK